MSNHHMVPGQAAIALDPADWYMATWRRLPPLPRPEPAPFDREQCAGRVAKATAGERGRHWDWTKARVPPAMTAEEACFWLEAMTPADTGIKPAEWARRLAGRQVCEAPTPKEVFARLRKSAAFVPPEIVLPLTHLLGVEAIVEALLGDAFTPEARQMSSYRPLAYLRTAVLAGFRKFAVPYLTAVEAEALRKRVAAGPIDRGGASPWGPQPVPLVLAAALGMHAEVHDAVSHWPDGALAVGDENAYAVLFGLGAAELVERHLRRTGLRLCRGEHARAWLAHTEAAALDVLRDHILAAETKERALALAEVLALVTAPAAAGPLLQLKRAGKAVTVARRWLDENVAEAVGGLIPVAADGGELAAAAADYLRDVARKGNVAVLEAQLAAVPAETAGRLWQEVLGGAGKYITPLSDEDTPQWLQLAAAPQGKLPRWLHPEHLPPLTLGGRPLKGGQVWAVLDALRHSTLEAPQPLVGRLKQHLDAAGLDAFVGRLFELWQAEGAPAKDRWVLPAVGLLGGDATAAKLAESIRAWPGQGQHKRAALGLECLRAVGTDAALAGLHAIALKVPFRGLQERARALMEELARARGLTAEQVEDRTGGDLDAGQPEEVAKAEARRLEQAMVSGRRWAADEFQTFVVRHPLRGPLARRVLWGVYDERGRLQKAFRLTEGGECVDLRGRPFVPEGGVGVVHPRHLDESERATWRRVFVGLKITAPFAQMDRPIHGLRAGEETAREWTHFGGVGVPANALHNLFKAYGWTDGRWHVGLFREVYMQAFPGQGVTAWVDTAGSDPLRIARVYFTAGTGPAARADPDAALPLGQVDPVAVSEVLQTLAALTSR
jgi:hypothetical protein